MATLEYASRRETEFQEERQECQLDPPEMPEWLADEREWQRKVAEYHRLRQAFRRLEEIKRSRATEQRTARFARILRRRGPEFSPISTRCDFPRPALPLLPETINWPGESSFGQQIESLLAKIGNVELRADCRAQCWIVKATNPDWTPRQVYSKATRTVRDARRGRYERVDGKVESSSVIVKREELRTQSADDLAFRLWQSAAIQDDETAEMEARIRILNEELDGAIVAGLESGQSVADIARMLNRSVDWVYRRIRQARESAEVQLRLPTKWQRSDGTTVTV